jgi:hypothetical protein
MQTATTYVSMITEHFLEVPKDILLAVALVTLMVAIAVWKGKQALFAVIIAMYPSALLTPLVATLLSPYLTHHHVSVLVFVTLIVLIYLPIRSVIGSFYHGSGPKKWFEIIILGILSTGLLFSLLLTATTFQSLFTFSESMQTLFVGSIQSVLWMIIPVLCLKLCR